MLVMMWQLESIKPLNLKSKKITELKHKIMEQNTIYPDDDPMMLKYFTLYKYQTNANKTRWSQMMTR